MATSLPTVAQYSDDQQKVILAVCTYEKYYGRGEAIKKPSLVRLVELYNLRWEDISEVCKRG